MIYNIVFFSVVIISSSLCAAATNELSTNSPQTNDILAIDKTSLEHLKIRIENKLNVGLVERPLTERTPENRAAELRKRINTILINMRIEEPENIPPLSSNETTELIIDIAEGT